MDTWMLQCLDHWVHHCMNALECGVTQIQKAVINHKCCQRGASESFRSALSVHPTHTYTKENTYRHSDPYSLIWIISSRHLDLRVSRLSEESVWWLCFIVPEGQDLQSSPSVLHRAPGSSCRNTLGFVFLYERRGRSSPLSLKCFYWGWAFSGCHNIVALPFCAAEQGACESFHLGCHCSQVWHLGIQARLSAYTLRTSGILRD